MRENECALSTGRLRLWDGGPKDAPAMLLLHSAFGDAAFSWSPIWDDLAARYRVIAPDMPGFGASEAPAGMSLRVMVGALRELLVRVDVGRAIVVGNSFGVTVAIALAEIHPECVDRLVLVNGTTLPPIPSWIKRAATMPFFEDAISSTFRRATYGRKAIASAFPHASAEELPSIAGRIEQGAAANFETLKDCGLHSEAQRPKLALPITLLWGADDGFTPIAVARELQKTLPGAELIEIARAGHLPQWDQPREFLTRLQRAAG